MCFGKKKPNPRTPGKLPSSLQPSRSSLSKTNLAQKKNNPSNSSKVSSKGHPSAAPAPSHSSSSLKEQTCITEKSDLMQISLYKAKDKKKEGSSSGSGPVPAKPPDHNQDSPEVFENNAEAVSLHPLNVTQIFMDSALPQTNVSKMHTDIIDQNTLEHVDLIMDDRIYSECDSDEERNPEVVQPRPQANVLRPEDETLDDTFSGRTGKTAIKIPSERPRPRTVRASHHPSTPDKNATVYTPPPPTERHLPLLTGKRTPRGGLSTRTTRAATMTARKLRSPATEHRQVQQTQRGDIDATATCRSKEPLDRTTQRATRIPTTSTIQTAMPMDPKDHTCPSRETVFDTATAKQTYTAMHGYSPQ